MIFSKRSDTAKTGCGIHWQPESMVELVAQKASNPYQSHETHGPPTTQLEVFYKGGNKFDMTSNVHSSECILPALKYF